ncbi:MAG: hypothetical protein ACTSX1_09340 [Candidatus Heimdallarchaeaceae archaeon]
MILKEKFDLLKGVDNILTLSPAEVKRNLIENGPRKIFVTMELEKGRINHFAKEKVYKLISGKKVRQVINVLDLKNYSLPISMNKKDKKIIINISPFGVDDILTTKPGPIDLYTTLVYGMVFHAVATKKLVVQPNLHVPISDFFVSLIVQFFGKQYGLLGSFSSQIVKLKFLTNVYILQSFFGLTGRNLYTKASVASSFDYREIEDKLKKYNFLNINDYILALSDFGVLPNINRHIFAGKLLNQFKLNFLPALEDLSRFMGIIAGTSVRGNSFLPTYIFKYNERAYYSILEIIKKIS